MHCIYKDLCLALKPACNHVTYKLETGLSLAGPTDEIERRGKTVEPIIYHLLF